MSHATPAHLSAGAVLGALGLAVLVSACAGTGAGLSRPGMNLEQAWPAPQHLAGLSCVAVLPFANNTAEAWAGHLLSQLTADSLWASGRFNVLEPMEAGLLLEPYGIRATSTFDTGRARELGEILDVPAVLIGSVSSFTSRKPAARQMADEPIVAMSVRLVLVKTGDVIWSASVSDFDLDVLLRLPHSRAHVARGLVSAMLTDLLERTAPLAVDRRVCWRVPFEPTEASGGPAVDQERYAVVAALGGETLEDLIQLYYLQPQRSALVTEANPCVPLKQKLARGDEVWLPRYVDYTTKPQDTLTRIAVEAFGHPAYAELIYSANLDILTGRPRAEPSSRPAVLLDARQKWNRFEVVGNVVEKNLVAGGVAVRFPRVRAALSGLGDGRRLAVKIGQPLAGVIFRVELEEPDRVQRWRLAIRDAAGNTVQSFAAEGVPPAEVPWDGSLEREQALIDGGKYSYQLEVEYAGNMLAGSAQEAFGVNTRADQVPHKPTAILRHESLPVTGDRFSERFDARAMAGPLPVRLVASDGSFGVGEVLVPSVVIVRPRRVELLELGVSNNVYEFPRVIVTDQGPDVSQLQALGLSFTLSGRTEPGNQLLVGGRPVPVSARGDFEAKLQLKPGVNVVGVLGRGANGGLSMLELEIVVRILGPQDKPWEYVSSEPGPQHVDPAAVLQAGMSLRLPMLRLPTETRGSWSPALAGGRTGRRLRGSDEDCSR